MNLENSIVLKENYTFLVTDADGYTDAPEHGLYSQDTRYLSRYRWEYGAGFQRLFGASSDGRSYVTHHARMRGDAQAVAIERRIRVMPTGLEDTITVENTSLGRETVSLTLLTEADFTDVFVIRGLFVQPMTGTPERRENGDGLSYRYQAADRLAFGVDVSVSPKPDTVEDGKVVVHLVLSPGERHTLSSRVRITSPFLGESGDDLITYQEWRSSFAINGAGTNGAFPDAAVTRALDDLRSLLLFTPHGPVPAAGVPWYGAVFGRDAILAAFMMIPFRCDVAWGTLRYLAAYQGVKKDIYRNEEPGKIIHEMRFGELSRIGAAPHYPFYGSIDATPLFVILLDELFTATGDLTPVRELKPNWEAALHWIRNEGDLDGDGFLEYAATWDGELVPQSWKDSSDSMSHSVGSLAHGPVAPCEFQGYAYWAYRGAARFYGALGEAENAKRWDREAESLKRAFHDAFWQENIGMHAMALDGEKKPLRVKNSNAGQLLISGIVDDQVVPTLVKNLFSSELWSGWGIRTLGAGEKRYNPVSYHNGSVWPHDNALIAAGLEKYGYHKEARSIRDAILDLAVSQGNKGVPELISGYSRVSGAPPVTYPVACRPQAWGAACIPYLLYRVPLESDYRSSSFRSDRKTATSDR